MPSIINSLLKDLKIRKTPAEKGEVLKTILVFQFVLKYNMSVNRFSNWAHLLFFSFEAKEISIFHQLIFVSALHLKTHFTPLDSRYQVLMVEEKSYQWRSQGSKVLVTVY